MFDLPHNKNTIVLFDFTFHIFSNNGLIFTGGKVVGSLFT